MTVERQTSSGILPGLETAALARPGTGLRGRIHLVGIGGIGMSGIAEVLLTLGYRISGSDLRSSEATRRLADLGAEIHVGHDAAYVGADADVVVVSSAVDDANPEVREARRLRIPVIARAEMLAELMRMKCAVAVAGAHGKTTTTSLVADVLGRAGFDPTVVLGGRLKALGGSNARLGRSRYMVAEADESDGTFLLLKPTLAVVTNIDREHMDTYGSMERLIDAYVSFVNGIPFYGRAFLCSDCPNVVSMLGRLKKRYTTYGTNLDADYCAADMHFDGISSTFEVIHRGAALGSVRIDMPGRHTVVNALAAIAVGMEFGVPFAECAAALAAFEGIMRRFEIKGERGGVLVVDDYGHHPTEIKATLGAAAAFGRRVVAVFQPHRYSRTADLFEQFLRAFDDADEVVVTDIYPAGEVPIEDLHAERLAGALARCHRGRVQYVPAGPELPAAVAERTQPGDLVITLGAGDITAVAGEILSALER